IRCRSRSAHEDCQRDCGQLDDNVDIRYAHEVPGIEEAEEGRVHTRACDFDFKQTYGQRGDGFIEVHHKLSQLHPGTKTKLAFHWTPGKRSPAACAYRANSVHATASLAAFTGRALMIFRAGLALNIVGSLVNGLIPFRAFVAGFLMTTNFAKPRTTNAPVFLSSLYPISATVSMTLLTSFLAISVGCCSMTF